MGHPLPVFYVDALFNMQIQSLLYNFFIFQFYLNPQEINRLERERNEEAQKHILLEIAKDKPVLNRTHAGSLQHKK